MRRFCIPGIIIGAVLLTAYSAEARFGASPSEDDVPALASSPALPQGPGILAWVNPTDEAAVLDLAQRSEWVVRAYSTSLDFTAALRRQAEADGILGKGLYVVDSRSPATLDLSDNLADVVLVEDASLDNEKTRAEWMRVLRPLGRLQLGDEVIEKPWPEGADDWTHPYHAPDNNPQSRDLLARSPYRTQFLSGPYYVPFPAITVFSQGRMFRAFGHVAYKEREKPWVNTLAAFNAFNGTMLWKCPLEQGFNVHRNTLIATPDILYIADNSSCKKLDAATGELLGEIHAPEDAFGPSWKWMAIEDGVLYALLGEKESPDASPPGNRIAAGWPWGPMTPAYDNKREYRWGRGRTFAAIDLESGKTLWRIGTDQEVDNRAVCMKNGCIYYYCDPCYVATIRTSDGSRVWKNDTNELLAAIGPHDGAQTHTRGFSTQAYVCCDDRVLYFAGPQRRELVAVAVEDGRLLWRREGGNYQMVLRDGVAYALARTEPDQKSRVFEPMTGEVLAEIPFLRGNCTRATGTADSIFTRGPNHGGTLRVSTDDLSSERIALMRPPCMDGVVATGGLLHWGPWMCDCSLSLVGNVCLAPVGETGQRGIDTQRLVVLGDAASALPITEADWLTYRADNRRTCSTPVEIATRVGEAWRYDSPEGQDSTAPIAGGGLVFIAGSDGVVRAIDAQTGERKWTAYVGGTVFYPPSLTGDGKLLVGAGDGYVHAFNAATGEALWRYRIAPEERVIPVHGRLMSTWPVAGGVLVEGDRAYAAAGIASYDKTYVVALDAKTGQPIWENDASGSLGEQGSAVGVSVQGHMLLHDGDLYLAGGNVVSPATYDVDTGECKSGSGAEWQTKAPRGCELFLAGGRVEAFDRLLYAPKRYWQGRYFNQPLAQVGSKDCTIRVNGSLLTRIPADDPIEHRRPPVWGNRLFSQVQAVAVAKNAVVVAGEIATSPISGFAREAPSQYAVIACDADDGSVLWRKPLDAMPLRWGIAADADGRVLITLQNGDVVCLAESKEK